MPSMKVPVPVSDGEFNRIAHFFATWVQARHAREIHVVLGEREVHVDADFGASSLTPPQRFESLQEFDLWSAANDPEILAERFALMALGGFDLVVNSGEWEWKDRYYSEFAVKQTSARRHSDGRWFGRFRADPRNDLLLYGLSDDAMTCIGVMLHDYVPGMIEKFIAKECFGEIPDELFAMIAEDRFCVHSSNELEFLPKDELAQIGRMVWSGDADRASDLFFAMKC